MLSGAYCTYDTHGDDSCDILNGQNSGLKKRNEQQPSHALMGAGVAPRSRHATVLAQNAPALLAIRRRALQKGKHKLHHTQS